MAQWCIIKFSSGETEIVPDTWVEGDKVFWPPYPPKDSIRLNAAIRKREQPRDGWHTYQPIRLLITRDTHDEAARSLERYINQNCDTTDIQSEGESHHGLKRKRRPNTIYESDEEPQDVSRFAQAPKVLFPDKPATQQASQDSQPSPPKMYYSLQRPNFPKSTIPASFPGDELAYPPLGPIPQFQRPSPEDSPGTARMALKDVAMQKLLTAVTELSKEVKDLREEFRQYVHSCKCGQTDSVGLASLEPLELPLHTMEALDRAEETLQNGPNRQNMTACLAIIGGTTLEVRVRRMMANLLTNELASGLNWAGKKQGKEQAKQKRPFKDLALCRSMLDAITQQLGTAAVTQYTFAQAVQKWLRYAPDRAGGSGRRDVM
ncbi:unnamed protein product [Gadus morhua 'NCC']|uniref:DUF4806 domain-containing protein n=1 Tax=Gadus morhua TaxID=8049 RepID=A0A8C5B9Y9_GADMO